MSTVVADAGPLHYLVLIDAQDILPKLFGRVSIPDIVAAELSRHGTPARVREWLAGRPTWLDIPPAPTRADNPSETRDAGERAAIGLTKSLSATLLLINDRAGDEAATKSGLRTIGTLGLLLRAAQLGWVDVRAAFHSLRETNFRCRPELMDALLIQSGYEAL